jgi:ferredoxin
VSGIRLEKSKSGSTRTFLFSIFGFTSLVACVIVYIFYGFTASLILAQFIAVPLAIVFIVDAKIRQGKAKRGGKDTGWWTGIVVEGKKVRIRVDWNSCMGSSSCVELAPKVFRLDWSKKRSVFEPAPLELLDERPQTTNPDLVYKAAQSCPYHAIILEDDESNERIFP